MRAVGYRHCLPIENADSLLDIEIDSSPPQGRDLQVAVKAINSRGLEGWDYARGTVR